MARLGVEHAPVTAGAVARLLSLWETEEIEAVDGTEADDACISETEEGEGKDGAVMLELELGPEVADARAGGADGAERTGTGVALADASALRIASTRDGMIWNVCERQDQLLCSPSPCFLSPSLAPYLPSSNTSFPRLTCFLFFPFLRPRASRNTATTSLLFA